MPLDPCRPVRAHLSDQLDGEALPLATRLLVRLHLTICPPCRRVHRSLVATQAALRALRDADVADDDVTPGSPSSNDSPVT
jgi:predicted anti-sigma-YlaC factor YlaD